MSNVRSTLLAFALFLWITPVATMLLTLSRLQSADMSQSECGSAYLGLIGVVVFSFYPVAFGIWAMITRANSSKVNQNASWIQLMIIGAFGVIPMLFWWHYFLLSDY